MTHTELVTYCALFTAAEFDAWFQSLDQQQRAELFPTFDHYMDCHGAAAGIPGHSTYVNQ